jgi:hypothetical protein
VQIGPSGDFSDIQAGMSEIGTKSDHPQVTLDVLKAATSDLHILQSVLMRPSKNSHSPKANIRQKETRRSGLLNTDCFSIQPI